MILNIFLLLLLLLYHYMILYILFAKAYSVSYKDNIHYYVVLAFFQDHSLYQRMFLKNEYFAKRKQNMYSYAVYQPRLDVESRRACLDSRSFVDARRADSSTAAFFLKKLSSRFASGRRDIPDGLPAGRQGFLTYFVVSK